VSPLEPSHVSPRTSQTSLQRPEPSRSDSVAYSDSFVDEEITREDVGGSEDQSDVPSEALSVGDSGALQKGREVAEKKKLPAADEDASQSIRYSDTFDQPGGSESATSVATDSSRLVAGRDARWDEEVTSVMKRVTEAPGQERLARGLGKQSDDVNEVRDIMQHRNDARGLFRENQREDSPGFGSREGQVDGIRSGKEVGGEDSVETGEKELIEELPEEWSGESTGHDQEDNLTDHIVESTAAAISAGGVDGASMAAHKEEQQRNLDEAETSPENPEAVLTSFAEPSEILELRQGTEGVASEPDEYSDSFASEADLDDDVSSSPFRSTSTGEEFGGKEKSNTVLAEEGGQPVQPLGISRGLRVSGAAEGLGGLGDGLSAWETSESPGAIPGHSLFGRSAREKVPGLDTGRDGDEKGMRQLGNEITGVEDLEEVDEELEFDENDFEPLEEDEGDFVGKKALSDVALVRLKKEELPSEDGGQDLDEPGEMNRLRGVGNERLVKAADGVLEDLVATEIEGERTKNLLPSSSCCNQLEAPSTHKHSLGVIESSVRSFLIFREFSRFNVSKFRDYSFRINVRSQSKVTGTVCRWERGKEKTTSEEQVDRCISRYKSG
jgi:hypothetical protein